MQPFWTATDAASYAGCSVATITRAHQRGELRVAQRIGHVLVFDPDEARRWADERRARKGQHR